MCNTNQVGNVVSLAGKKVWKAFGITLISAQIGHKMSSDLNHNNGKTQSCQFNYKAHFKKHN